MIKNDKEKKALSVKLYTPKEHVICPRCGAELLHKKVGISSVAYCPTPNCIKAALRGI